MTLGEGLRSSVGTTMALLSLLACGRGVAPSTLEDGSLVRLVADSNEAGARASTPPLDGPSDDAGSDAKEVTGDGVSDEQASPLEEVLNDYSSLLYDRGTRQIHAHDFSAAEKTLGRALLYAPNTRADETLRSRLFFGLATVARLRGYRILASSYYRASYLLSSAMIRPGMTLVHTLPSVEDLEAKTQMGLCPAAVVPFEARTFSDRAAAVSFLRSVTRRVGVIPENPLFVPKLAKEDDGVAGASLVGATVGDSGAWWFALLRVSVGVVLIDTRVVDGSCGPWTSCGEPDISKQHGVWKVSVERSSLGPRECYCDKPKSGEESARDSCDGCKPHCECRNMSGPTRFGPRESYFIDATTGSALWHVLSEPGESQGPVEFDSSSIRIHSKGCPESWPAPQRKDASTVHLNHDKVIEAP
jgi:hypothetical protein